MNILAGVVFVTFIVVVLCNIGKFRGCSGTCEQGRKPCDCKEKE